MMLPNELIYMIISYLYNMDISLYDYITVSKYWASTAIPILWENLFEIKYRKNKINALKRIIFYNLTNTEQDLYDEFFPIKYHKKPLFPYLSFVKKINTFH